MDTLLVEGLDGEGPGDIVGAFVGEAEVSPDAIGDIDVRDGRARVEIDKDVAQAVVDAMDGNRVGPSRVRVFPDDEQTRRVRDHVETYQRLVELEREEEMRRHEAEIRSTTGPEREAKGRAMIDMRGVDEGQSLAGHEVKFLKRRREEPLPETEIAVGDLAMVSKDDPLREDNPTGTVTKKTNWTIHVAFDREPPDFLLGEGLRLDLYVNDITYQRMKAALDRLRTAEARLAELRDTLIGLAEPAEPDPTEVEAWYNEQLDDSQRLAVRRALGAEDVHLVHGPPGTGKTTTAIEVIQQAVGAGDTVLATAASNTAVDNLVSFLVDQGVYAVRVGHPARVTPRLHEHTLDHLVQQLDTYHEARRAREKAFELKDEQDEHTFPRGRWRRGMSDEQIHRYAEQGTGSRGVPPDKIQSMAKWLELEERIDELFAKHDRLREEAIDEILDHADVVCTTNSTAGSDLLADRTFDLLVLDEATQATEPSAWIPITHARKVVMAGDHRQLPPTVLNREAAREGLRASLFERVAGDHGEPVRDLLEVQYRMHEDIMTFSGERFYDGRLAADATVRDHTLEDLGVDVAGLDEEIAHVLDPEHPVTFVDTADVEAAERSPPGSPSKENPREAEIVARLARGLLAAGLDPAQVALITPYDAQKDRLNGLLDVAGLEIDTVDGFQGREKEAVVISLVRSNPSQELGFLTDLRRLNVALTRAKRKLVVVGDTATIADEEAYTAFVDHADEVGRLVEL
jgi:predicted DNA helicase